jgi:hypothetical protein
VERSNDEVRADALTGLAWRKSRRSNPSGNCVELALLPSGTGVAVRNSRDPNGPALVYHAGEIAAFSAASGRGIRRPADLIMYMR